MVNSTRQTYFPAINLLRSLAVLSICLYHFTHSPEVGAEGLSSAVWLNKIGDLAIYFVHIFFVVSGFVIPLSLKSSGYHLKNYFRFLGRRLVRIDLPYIVLLAMIMLLEMAFAYKGGYSPNISLWRILHHLTFTIEFTDMEWYNPIFWTLAIEIQYYILAGIIYPLFLSMKKWPNALFLLLASSSCLIGNSNSFLHDYAPQFCLGILLFNQWQGKFNRKEAYVLAALISAILWYHTRMPFALTCLVCYFFIDNIRVDRKWINFLGDSSYSLYLVHGIVGGTFLLFAKRDFDMNDALAILLSLFLSLIFSFAFWRLIEMPARRLSRKVRWS